MSDFASRFSLSCRLLLALFNRGRVKQVAKSKRQIPACRQAGHFINSNQPELLIHIIKY